MGHGLQDRLAFDAVSEVRGRHLVLCDGVHQYEDLVDEGLPVPDDVSGGPPDAGEGMFALGRQDRSEALDVAFVRSGLILELVHLLEVERQTPLAPVDLEAVEVLATAGKPRSLEGPQRSVGELSQEHRGVLHRHLRASSTCLHSQSVTFDRLRRTRTVFDERLLHRHHFVKVSD